MFFCEHWYTFFQHWHTLLGQTVEAPSLELFRPQLDTTLSNLLWARAWARWSPGVLSHLSYSLILWFFILFLFLCFCFPNNRYMRSCKGWKGKTFFFMIPIWQQNVFPVRNMIHQFLQEWQIKKNKYIYMPADIVRQPSTSYTLKNVGFESLKC